MRLCLAPAFLSSLLMLGASGCDPASSGAADTALDDETAQGSASAESSGESEGQAGEVEFSNFRIEELTSVRALVRFDTSLDTTCELEYGLSAEVMDGRATDPDMEPGTFLMEHQVPLEDLNPETTYWFRARAETEAGDVYFSEPMSLTTLADESGETGADTGGAEFENVALLAAGAEVSAVSSNWAGGSNSDSFGADLAFDDMMATAWSSDGDGDDAWIEVTLPSARALDRVGFRSREMTDGTSKIFSFTLLVDGTRSYGPFDTPDTTQVYTFELDGEMGQTIRLETATSSGGNTGIRELQLWSPVP